MVRERDLEEAIVELREVKMEDGTLEAAKHSFVDYLEKEWMYGAYPPSVWNCFGRVEDCTINAQEAFNGVLNRMVKIFHPNPIILISYIVEELVSSEVMVDRLLLGGKVQKVQKKKYAKLLQETQAMKDK